jgi:hypothetical protein
MPHLSPESGRACRRALLMLLAAAGAGIALFLTQA